MKFSIPEFDIFYLSYDEPQKEEFWAKLLDIAPWAKRVDGVKGFDSAHKAAANASDTDRFITVDGDNTVFPEFFDINFELPERYQESVLSWNSRNSLNGLVYGNGGLKLWTKDFVLGMKTHENASAEEEKLDFCWKDRYVQLKNIYSETHPSGSPLQAFRAGFREGVKMSLDRGSRLDPEKMKKYIYSENLKRVLIWATVGADVENGLWSIYGTRLGLFLANLSDFKLSNISDYDWFKEYFNQDVFPGFKLTNGDRPGMCSRTGSTYSLDKLLAESVKLKELLQKGLGLELSDLNGEQSKFFKFVCSNAVRKSPNALTTENE